jgi:hypothetical protein
MLQLLSSFCKNGMPRAEKRALAASIRSLAAALLDLLLLSRWGVTEQTKDQAERIASGGFRVVIPDL